MHKMEGHASMAWRGGHNKTRRRQSNTLSMIPSLCYLIKSCVSVISQSFYDMNGKRNEIKCLNKTGFHLTLQFSKGNLGTRKKRIWDVVTWQFSKTKFCTSKKRESQKRICLAQQFSNTHRGTTINMFVCGVYVHMCAHVLCIVTFLYHHDLCM